MQSYLFLDETTQEQQDLHSREISEETKEEEEEGGLQLKMMMKKKKITGREGIKVNLI